MIDQVRSQFDPEQIEIINASIPGFTLVQTRLSAQELVKIYKPDIIFVHYSFRALALATVYFHLVSHSLDERGLANRMGPINYFWPIPYNWTPRLYSFPEMRFFATKLRTWQQVGMLRFGTENATLFSSAKRNTPNIEDLVQKYVRDIERIAIENKSTFFLLRNTKCFVGEATDFPFYTSDAAALRHSLVRNRQFDLCAKMESRSFLKDSTNEIQLATFPEPIERFLIPTDIHLNPMGTEFKARDLAMNIKKVILLHQGGARKNKRKIP